MGGRMGRRRYLTVRGDARKQRQFTDLKEIRERLVKQKEEKKSSSHNTPRLKAQRHPKLTRVTRTNRTNGPLVSIIIPCFNHGEYLDECVDSARFQIYKNIEIIIVDDCSTDGKTPRVVQRQLDKSNAIKVIFNEKNMKLPATRNVAIREASGKYILPLDADDKLHRSCVSYFVDAAEAGKGDIICGGTEMFGEMRGKGGPRPYNFEQLKKENLMQCTALYQKAHWEEVGGYNETMSRGYEDWEFWINMGKHGHYGYGVNHVLFYYRKKHNSMVEQAADYREEIIQHIHDLHPDLYRNAGAQPSKKDYFKSLEPKVSVIIPCYNASKFLRETVGSVLAQTFQDFEIILIDDMSTDNTIDMMEALSQSDSRIHLLFNPENQGPAGTRNHGIEQAKGKYIVPLDSDDKMDKTMLAKYVKVLDSGRADLVGSWYKKFGAHKDLVKTKYSFPQIAKSNTLSCCTAFHREHWKEVGGYNIDVNGYEDWELWINMGKHGHHVHVIKEPLLQYRTTRGATMITQAKKRDEKLRETIKKAHPTLYDRAPEMKKPITYPKNAKPLKIRVLAICYNEEMMLPFFLRYYTPFCKEVLIYDNYSTDKSVEIINSFPNTRVVQYDTGGKLSDKTYLEIKNNKWKEDKSKYDWQIVVDTDEFIWHPRLLQVLGRYRDARVSLPKIKGFNMVHDHFPEDDGRQIMDIINKGVGKPNYCKPAIFCPRMIKEMGYGPGAHKADPKGVVKESSSPEIFFLHYKYFGIHYFRERARLYAPRLKGVNYNWGQMEYLKQVNASPELYEKWAETKKAKEVFKIQESSHGWK